MTIIDVRCGCGSVEMSVPGEPMAQYVCHRDDCQTVHGKAYPVLPIPNVCGCSAIRKHLFDYS
jgi:hypothetical protein